MIKTVHPDWSITLGENRPNQSSRTFGSYADSVMFRSNQEDTTVCISIIIEIHLVTKCVATCA